MDPYEPLRDHIAINKATLDILSIDKIKKCFKDASKIMKLKTLTS